MRVYLAQHGHAVAEEVDPARPLSPRGRTDVEALARLLGEAGVRVGAVVHSGKARAEQTARLLAQRLLPAGPVDARPGLGPKDPVEPVAGWVEGLAADTLIAGHQPFLGHLASRLLAGDADRVAVAFEPGSIACLEQDAEKAWRLLWMVRPELLRAASA
jgi:phosphohistidine phosphatase